MVLPDRRGLPRQVEEALLQTRINSKAEIATFLPKSHQAKLADLGQVLVTEPNRCL
jgi:hypothetical protein